MTTTATDKTVTTRVFRVWIKAPAQTIWDAITSAEWTKKYGYEGAVEYDLRPGGSYKAFPSEAMKAFGPIPDVIIVGEVIESDPPKKLVQTWHPIWDAAAEAEAHTRLTWQIEEEPGGICKVTVIHDLTGAPKLSQMVSGEGSNASGMGGWAWVLSDLKSLLETGQSMTRS